ncbi:sterol desaturase family protein [bacterium]|nr:sterol desaturase family protein [bacterium]
MAAVFSGYFLSLLAFERLFPLRERRRAFFARAFVNLVLAGGAFLIARAIISPLVEPLVRQTDKDFGVVNWLALPPQAAFVVGLLLMDVTFYYWHRLNHAVPFLWRFHNVHHFDPDLDVSTAFRFHFGEIAFSAAFRVVQIFLVGISPVGYVIYEGVFQAGTLFHHSNLKLPIVWERRLNLLIVTPRMHGIHHSQIRGETNSNYSVVFSFWDRLHRTIVLGIPQDRIRIGVPGYMREGDNRLANVLFAPFRRQREYWRADGGDETHREPADVRPGGTLAE